MSPSADRPPTRAKRAHLCCVFTGKKESAAVEALNRKEAELQGRDHAEVALAAAQRPEQIRLGGGGDPTQLAVSSDDLDRLYVVGGVAMRAAQDRACPAAEMIADDAHGRRAAAERSEPVLVSLVEYPVPAGATFDAGEVSARIDVDAFIRDMLISTAPSAERTI